MTLFALSIGDAANAAGIPVSTMKSIIAFGQGPRVRVIGRRDLILCSDFDKWLATLPDLQNLPLSESPLFGYEEPEEPRSA